MSLKKFSKRVSLIGGLAISVIFLYLSFRGLEWDAFYREIVHFEWRFFLIALSLAVLHNFVSALRWWLLLNKSGPVGFWEAFWNLRVAYFCNATLPGKVGEAVKIYLIKKRTIVSAGHAIGAMSGDRILEFVSLLFLLLLSGLILGFRDQFFLAHILIGGFVLVLLFLFVLWMLPRETTSKLRPLFEFFDRVRAGLRPLSRPKVFTGALLISIFAWVLHGGMVVLFSMGLEERISFFKAILVVAGVTFAVAIPASPGNFGTFEFAVIYIVNSLFGVSFEKAVSIALLYHAVQLIPTYIFGLIGVSLLGIRRKDLPIETD